MPIYCMIKANDERNHNNRVNLYYASRFTGAADWQDLEREALQICAERGWSLIVWRPVPERAALEQIAEQNNQPTG